MGNFANFLELASSSQSNVVTDMWSILTKGDMFQILNYTWTLPDSICGLSICNCWTGLSVLSVSRYLLPSRFPYTINPSMLSYRKMCPKNFKIRPYVIVFVLVWSHSRLKCLSSLVYKRLLTFSATSTFEMLHSFPGIRRNNSCLRSGRKKGD